MKKLFRYLNVALLLIGLSTALVACHEDDENGYDDLGLTIKVFSPTVVVPGQPMTINGSGFSDVTAIVFPGDIVVTNFEVVTDEMIRVAAPQGLQQAGTITLRNAAGETAVSRLPLSLGKTAILGYSAQEGDLLKGNESFTAYGKDMQFVLGAEFIDEDGNPIYVDVKEFTRVATGRVVIPIPAKVFQGNFSVKIYMPDGTIVETPAFEFEPASSGGHWESVKRFIWENDGSHGSVSWDGAYRFGLDGKDGNNECITTFDQATWDIIKEGTVYFLYDGNDGSNVRITTGWWSAAYGGAEHNCIDMAEDDPETSLKVIAVNIKEEGSLYDLIDDQHLLFTGDAYTPMGLFVLDQVWIEGEGELVKVKTSFWKNGEQSTIPAPSWSGEGRFSSVSHSTGEETYAFPDDVWETLKSEPFRIAIEKINENAPNIRITTGWWSTAYGGGEYNCAELLEEDEDGVLFMEVNLSLYEALLNAIDVEHLLFTGSDYRLLEIYQEKEEWIDGGGGAQKIVTIWENDGSHGGVSWDSFYRFSNVETSTGEEVYAVPMDQWAVMKDGTFYLQYDGNENSNVRITTGWWSAAYGGGEFNCAPLAINDDEGHKLLELNIKEDGNLYDLIDAQHFLVTGDAFTPLKLFYYENQ